MARTGEGFADAAPGKDNQVLMFIRDTPQASDPIIVIGNLSANTKRISVHLTASVDARRMRDALSGKLVGSPQSFRATLSGYAVKIICANP